MKNNTQPALKERIEKALDDFTKGRASMHVPPLDTDVDVVLAESSDRLSELEARCAALAAENAGLKDINAWCKTDAFKNMYREFKTAEAIGCHDVDCMHDAMLTAIMHAPKTPATDAFLAEVRAQESKRVYESILDNPAVTDMGSLVDWLEQNANDSIAFAAQLRKEADQ